MYNIEMQTHIPNIEATIKSMPRESLAQFDEWYQDFIAKTWDKEFENDVNSGQMEKLAKKSIDSGREEI